MSLQPKKITTITFAILFGVAIVIFSLSGDRVSWLSPTAYSSPATTNSDWRDTLVVVPSRTPTSLLGTEYTRSGATTTTNFIANEFAANYALAQVNKGAIPLGDTDIQGIIQTLSDKAKSVDTIKQYGEQDLLLVSAATSTIAAYKKEVMDALMVFAQKNKTNELLLVAQAVDERDQAKLGLLSFNITNYQSLVDALLAISVPRTVSAFHLSLVQGHANMLAGIVDMKEIITDPVRGMRGVAKYNNGAKLIDTAIAMLGTQKK